jgi:hypothetical protein
MSTKATQKPQQRKPKTGKAIAAIRTIWQDSQKRPKAYVDRFLVPSEGE